jgi:hypothetical protein
MFELRSTDNDRMILEGMVSTISRDGGPHFSPMGPDVNREQTSLVLKPFCTSTTFTNLSRDGRGVFHIIDDVLLLASGAINRWEKPPKHYFGNSLGGFVIEGACRALAFQVDEIVDDGPRAIVACRITNQLTIREFFGWNRAQHAVLELAILATRLHLLEREFIDGEIARLLPLVEKTGGVRERQAWGLLVDHIDERSTKVP